MECTGNVALKYYTSVLSETLLCRGAIATLSNYWLFALTSTKAHRQGKPREFRELNWQKMSFPSLKKESETRQAARLVARCRYVTGDGSAPFGVSPQ